VIGIEHTKNAVPGRILVADDEPASIAPTLTFLRHEGYECDYVADGTTATKKLSAERYDILIADINMPGNEALELIRGGPLEGVAVILVTAHPTLDTAIQSVRLPVTGYLVKPLRFDELRKEIARAMELSGVYGSVTRARERLDSFSQELQFTEAFEHKPSLGLEGLPVQTFVEATLRNVGDALKDLAWLTTGLYSRRLPEADLCRMVRCKRREALASALDETIEILEKTKRSFKSKDLGHLRQKLEALKKSGLF